MSGVTFPAAVLEETGEDGSAVDCAGAETAGAGAETDGAAVVGAEAASSETVGAAAGVCASGGAECFRAKKKSTATRMIAAAEATTISVVAFDVVDCFGLGDGDVNVAAVAKDSTAGTGAGGGGS